MLCGRKVSIHQRSILGLVYPWYTNTEQNRRKNEINSFTHARIFDIYTIYMPVKLKERKKIHKHVSPCIILLWFFGLLSSSLLLLVETQNFICCILLRPSSGVPCLSEHRNDSTWETLKMISLVESFLYPYKQGTPEEGRRRIQWPKHCVSTNINKDEDNSLKNHDQNNTHQASSQKFRQIMFQQLKPYIYFAQSARGVEYTDCFSAEG